MTFSGGSDKESPHQLVSALLKNHAFYLSASFFSRTFLSFSSLGKTLSFGVFFGVFLASKSGQFAVQSPSTSLRQQLSILSAPVLQSVEKSADFAGSWFCFDRGGLICKGDSLGLLLWFSLFPLMGIFSMGAAGGFGFAWTGAVETCLGAEGRWRLCGDFFTAAV